MTQSIFLELSESFKIDITQARFSFSIVSLFYAASFFFLGPAADKFDLPKISVTGLLLLAITVFLLILFGKFQFVYNSHGFDGILRRINSGINVPAHREDFSKK